MFIFIFFGVMSNETLQNKTHKIWLTFVWKPCANSPKQVTHITCCNITACCCWRSAWSCCGDNTCCWRICCICWGVITWGVIMATDTGTCTGKERYHRQTHFTLPALQQYIFFILYQRRTIIFYIVFITAKFQFQSESVILRPQYCGTLFPEASVLIRLKLYVSHLLCIPARNLSIG